MGVLDVWPHSKVLNQAIGALRSEPVGGEDAGEAVDRLLMRLRAVRDNLCADPECHRHCKLSCNKAVAP